MTDERVRIGDLAAREHAILEHGSVLVQAPAGSGKTTLLAQRYLRLLARVDAPERILALTFTRRAAEEMRARVVDALQAAGLPECPAQMNRETWELGLAAARQLQRLDLDLAQHPARLRIETIDAFNGWLAAQLPILAGTGSRLRTEESAKSLYEEAARRALAHDADDAYGGAVDRVLALGDLRWRSLVERIAEMLPSRDRWLPLLAGSLEAASAPDAPQLERIRALFDADLAFLVTRSLGQAAAAIGAERIEVLSRLIAGAAARLGEQRPQLDLWRADNSCLREDPADLPRWRAMLSIVLLADGAIRSKVTKSEGFAPTCVEKPAMQDLLAELARAPHAAWALADAAALPQPLYSDADWSAVRDVAQVLVLAAAQLDQVFREAAAADFPAVSIAARRALGSPLNPTDLAMRLDYRLQHILIDEFQDTSASQLKLLEVLTAGWQQGDGRSVFCVGDPMQSIYRFRQAEVRAFLELAEDGIGDVRFDVLRLTSNFRTAKPLVDWINATFSRIMPARDDRDRGAIAYRPSESARDAPDGAKPGVAFARFESRDAEASGIADLIADRLAAHPDWHIAILVRAKAHARDIAERLRERGIAFGAVDIEALRDRAAVRDLIMLARALLHLGDRTAWLAVLRAPWAGLELRDLLIVARGAAVVWDALVDESVMAGLSADGVKRCARIRSVLASAMRVRGHSSFTRWLERTWLALGGPQCAADAGELEHARMAFARLRSLERSGLPDPAEFDAAFDDLFARDAGLSPVEIMTIHKAKGLEFDLVILPALERSISHRSDEFLLSAQFTRGDRDGLVMAARPAIGAEDRSLFDFLRRQAKQAALLEAERLLYVACTRAKWQLQLTATVNTGGGASDWTPRSGSLLQVLWPTAAADFLAASAASAPGGGVARDGALRGGPLRRVPLDWSPAALPAALEPAGAPGPIAAQSQIPPFDWAGETARLVGSLVHAELQMLQLDRDSAAVIRARQPQFRRWLESRGVPLERLDEASVRAISALIAVQEDPRGRWILRGGHRDESREYALSGVLNGEIVSVVFDRSFIDEQGLRWVIDYKTSRHLGSGLDEFLDQEVERYRAPMQRYAAIAQRLGPEPVRLGLYFPLMRAWREWIP
ncbi:MAG: UvrD-helicase domain-containing protein [Steroidobacteraceae bacterium]|jgi:ATP-dependent exoDNAse (exonuclease V) beta subunit